MTRSKLLVVVTLLVLLGLPQIAAAADEATMKPSDPELAPQCELLDDAGKRGRMDGLLRWLLIECGRADELGGVRQDVSLPGVPDSGSTITDVQVNDSGGDTGASTTQSETSISFNETTGTYCSGYNDSATSSFAGFSRSTNGGATWDDRGSLVNGSSGDPSVVWSRRDGKFYYAALRSGGLAIWRSDDDCLTFTFVAQIVTGSDDKELMAIDNNPTSAFYGRIYMAWTDFGSGSRIYNVFSDDGGATWSTQLAISGVGVDVQGAWPAVAPNGDYYVAWVRWNPFPSGNIDVEIVHSTNGGVSFVSIPNPMTDEVNPRDNAATGSCGRPALNGNIRYLPSPQIAVGPDGALHAVYSYDPDGFNVGDVIDVFYRKYSTNGPTPSWGTEIKLNDDAGLNDQYFATLSVSPENIVVSTFYDRRLDDPTNLLQDTFKTVSPDGGSTWLANERVSDVSTPIYLDPGLATCYHGDYDQIAQDTGVALLQWSDDRNMQNGHNDPDVWFEAAPVSNDFILTPTPSSLAVCAPDDAVYMIDVLQFQGFTEPVTLAGSGNPSGTSLGFSVNPVTPPGTSNMTIGNTGAGDAGSYTIDVTGTSDPSAIVHQTSVGLDLFTAIPGAPVLSMPPDNESNVNPMPTFEWQDVDQAATYTIEIATDAAFTNIVDTASGLDSATYTPDTDLDTNTRYYWRVWADNACGTGSMSAVWSFTTVLAPGDCVPGTDPLVHFFDDLEGDTSGWTTGGIGSTWVISGSNTHSGIAAFWGEDVAMVSDQYLVTPVIDLSAAGGAATLQFWNHQTIEDAGGIACFDGAVVAVSDDGGSNWTRLEAELLTDPYDGLVSNGFGNPLADENAWCGDPQDWLKSVVDIDAWAARMGEGNTVQFRFRLATDSSVGRVDGWKIDDIKVQSCVPDNGIFADGFESGNTDDWSDTMP